MEFKDKVKFVRYKLLLSQESLAKELGVAFATVNRWETGIRMPTFVLQRKFQDYCDSKGINFEEHNG